MKIPAIEYHGDRPCLSVQAYPVLYELATKTQTPGPTKWRTRIRKFFSQLFAGGYKKD